MFFGMLSLAISCCAVLSCAVLSWGWKAIGLVLCSVSWESKMCEGACVSSVSRSHTVSTRHTDTSSVWQGFPASEETTFLLCHTIHGGVFLHLKIQCSHVPDATMTSPGPGIGSRFTLHCHLSSEQCPGSPALSSSFLSSPAPPTLNHRGNYSSGFICPFLFF